jgi:RNA polymerase sigma-70 factor (ECF subfamily)
VQKRIDGYTKKLRSMNRFEFNNLVIQHSDSLRSYARNFTREQEDANDLVQDTLLKAVTYFKNFREGTNLKGWLYTIMKNTFINNYRRITKLNSFLTKEEEISPANLMVSASYNQGENKFIADDIQNTMSNLTDDYYVPFNMYYEGYKYHEISEHLDIPIGTVKTRIHMARKTMKKKLTAYEYGHKICIFGEWMENIFTKI